MISAWKCDAIKEHPDLVPDPDSPGKWKRMLLWDVHLSPVAKPDDASGANATLWPHAVTGGVVMSRLSKETADQFTVGQVYQLAAEAA